MSKYFFLLITVVLTACTAFGSSCVVPDNGTGTASLPPQGCSYICLDKVYTIIDGLPPGTEILIDAAISQFFNIMSQPGGSLGGEIEQFQATFNAPIEGKGDLIGFTRNITGESISPIGPCFYGCGIGQYY